MNRKRSWGTCHAGIKYHTSSAFRRVSSAGCHLLFKKTNTLRWQAHTPSEQPRHLGATTAKHLWYEQTGNSWRVFSAKEISIRLEHATPLQKSSSLKCFLFTLKTATKLSESDTTEVMTKKKKKKPATSSPNLYFALFGNSKLLPSTYARTRPRLEACKRHVGTCFCGGLGTVRFTVRLDDFKSLFPSKWFYVSKLWCHLYQTAATITPTGPNKGQNASTSYFFPSFYFTLKLPEPHLTGGMAHLGTSQL